MRGTARTAGVAGIAAVALLAAGCGGGDDSAGDSDAGTTGGAITIQGCNPQNPLIPGNTNETCGGNVLDATAARLVHYNSDTAEPEMDIAESIDTTDNQTFTIKLVPGYMFQNGTEVKAKNFVDAWNDVAYGPNGANSSYFMEPIEGYGDLQSTDPDEDGPKEAPEPKAKEMSGLAVVDDYTFTVKTTEKVSNLPVRLGYTAFAPLPDVYFDDPVAYGDKPIAAGPYMVDEWAKNSEIKLSKFADYSGKFAGKVDSITFKIIDDSETAYRAVQADELDIGTEVPTSALIDEIYKKDLPDRNADKATGVIQTVTFAPDKTDPSLANPKLRQAISMAIDRQSIIDNIFNGTRIPATGWVAPVVDGYKEGQCGEYCTYDPAKAKALFEEAGGYNGKITLGYNADADHKPWTEATCNSIKSALGVDCVAIGTPTFAAFRTQITEHKMKGMFRTGWQMDYPSIENFLVPIYKTGASSNDGLYSNAEFDQDMVDAAAATDPAAATELYQQGEALLATDMSSIPLWYGKTTIGWSNNVDNVKITPFGTIDLANVTVK